MANKSNIHPAAKPHEDMPPSVREHEIVKASVIGIAGNMLLVAFKMVIGFFSHSIAIILDGVNNATDALSSIITIVGTKVAGRPPDAKHPFGYGRIEYLTSVVIAVIILVAGALSLRESILKIIHPATPSYSTITITIIVVAILGKVVLGIVFKRYGDKTSCEALIASGVDSNYDAVLSAGTLVVAFAQNLWNVNIDGAVGVVISLVVCKAGIEVLHDALAPIIGTPEDREHVANIKRYIRTFPNVCDVHNVVMDNFGPNKIDRIGVHRRSRRPYSAPGRRTHQEHRQGAAGQVQRRTHRGDPHRQHHAGVRAYEKGTRGAGEEGRKRYKRARLLRRPRHEDLLLRHGGQAESRRQEGQGRPGCSHAEKVPRLLIRRAGGNRLRGIAP